ncbi:hypothetical protein GCM10010226_68690 [Streptomyces phaeofaciens]|uniref:Uncharacterized protein n=1 Tax=Streptomyces phaeofaciens TaxID=68254 RepID=A0A918HP89_9ACTN|nr:hypothetical protein GCM10010226_68690 [Streptomyces phaeofaciens]
MTTAWLRQAGTVAAGWRPKPVEQPAIGQVVTRRAGVDAGVRGQDSKSRFEELQHPVDVRPEPMTSRKYVPVCKALPGPDTGRAAPGRRFNQWAIPQSDVLSLH